MSVQAVGILWPDPENYARFAAVSEDEVHPTYEDFVAANQPRIDALEREGVRVHKQEFDPDEMVRWCQANGCKVDPQGRARYATWLTIQRHRSGH